MSISGVDSLRRQEPAGIEVPEGQVRVLESHHAADFAMSMGDWPFHKLCWVAIGRGVLEFSTGSTRIEPNDFLLLPAQWRHRFVDEASEPLTLVILCVSGICLSGENHRRVGELWQSALAQSPAGAAVCAKTAFHRSSLIEWFRRALREQGNRRIGWEITLESIAYQLVASVARGYCELRERHQPTSRQAVRGAIDYLDTHVYESFRIDGMAGRCGLSPRRFTDLFKQQTGDTFNCYLNRRRIAYACERLNETEHILYACHESGFNDVAYFYRVFKKETGKTPGQYLRERQLLESNY